MSRKKTFMSPGGVRLYQAEMEEEIQGLDDFSAMERLHEELADIRRAYDFAMRDFPYELWTPKNYKLDSDNRKKAVYNLINKINKRLGIGEMKR